MTYPQERHMFNAEEPERVAYEIARAAHDVVRALELQTMFGIDLGEAHALANQTVTASAASDVDAAMDRLRNIVDKYRSAGILGQLGLGLDSGAASAPEDSQGEQQIAYDLAAWNAAERAALMHDTRAIGEEDEFRHEPDGGAKKRGERLVYFLKNNMRVAIVDPLDGSNQVAGMGQRSGWGSCAMVLFPGVPWMAVAVLLGDGRGFVAFGGRVWMSEATHPDRIPVFYEIAFDDLAKTFPREHYVVPAAKRSSLERAFAIMLADQSIQWVSPLGGNPGILAALLGARGTIAAMQPRAFAWDHMAALVLANAGFPVLRAGDEVPLTAAELTELFLTDLARGEKTETLYMGRSMAAVKKLRHADLTARTGAEA